LVEAWLDGAFTLVSSDAQLEELTRVLTYPHLRKRIAPQEADVIVRNIRNLADHAEPIDGIEVSVDPDDNLILATALAGGVDLVVSGDKPGMLAVGSIEGIPIVSPADALKRLLER